MGRAWLGRPSHVGGNQLLVGRDSVAIRICRFVVSGEDATGQRVLTQGIGQLGQPDQPLDRQRVAPITHSTRSARTRACRPSQRRPGIALTRRSARPDRAGHAVRAVVAVATRTLLPRWIFLGLGGSLLIGLAATYERRRRDHAWLRAEVTRLS